MANEYVYNQPEVEVEVLATNGNWNPADFVFALTENASILKSGTLFVKANAESTNIVASVVNFNRSGTALYEVCDPGSTPDNSLLGSLPTGVLTTANFGTAIREAHTSLYAGSVETLRTTVSGVRVGLISGDPASTLHLVENNALSGTQVGITVQQLGSGDATLRFINTATWSLGIDGSDVSKFKLCSSDALGSSTALSVNTSNKVGIGTDSVLTFNASATLFASSSPKLEVVTGSGSTAYKEGLVLRHLDTGTSGSLFLAFKHKDETSAANSNIMTGLESKVSGSSLTLNLIAEGTTGIVLSSGTVAFASSVSTQTGITASFNGPSYFSGNTFISSASTFTVSGISLFSGDTTVQDFTVNGDITFPNGFALTGSIAALAPIKDPSDYGFTFATSGDLLHAPATPSNPTVLLVENVRTDTAFAGGYSPGVISGLFVRTAPESGVSAMPGTVSVAAQAIYNSNNTTPFAGGSFSDFKAINFLAKSPNAPSRAPLGTQSPIYSYGLFIESQKTGVVSGGWGIYQEGTTDQNYLAGITTIGSEIIVSGNATISGDFYLSGNQHWRPSTNILLEATGNDQEWSLDLINQDVRDGCYWQVRSDASGGTGTSILAVRGDSLRVGILTTNPTEALDVNGSALVRSSATISGSLTVHSGASLSGNVGIGTSISLNRQLTVQGENSDSTILPIIEIRRLTTAGTVNNGIGSIIEFSNHNSVKEETVTNKIKTVVTDVTSDAEDSEFRLTTLQSGYYLDSITVGSSLTSNVPIDVNGLEAITLTSDATVGTDHSFFVQAIDANGFSASVSNTFKVSGYPTGKTFSWNTIPGASSYRIWAAFNNNLDSPVQDSVYNLLWTLTGTSYVYEDIVPVRTGTATLFSNYSGSLVAGVVKSDRIISPYRFTENAISSEFPVTSNGTWTQVAYVEMVVPDYANDTNSVWFKTQFSGRIELNNTNYYPFTRFYYEFRNPAGTITASGQSVNPPLDYGGSSHRYGVAMHYIQNVVSPGTFRVYLEARNNSASKTSNLIGYLTMEQLN